MPGDDRGGADRQGEAEEKSQHEDWLGELGNAVLDRNPGIAMRVEAAENGALVRVYVVDEGIGGERRHRMKR